MPDGRKNARSADQRRIQKRERILVLADDLTGALEVGAQFAGRGISTRVTTELSLSAQGADETIQVLVVDTETRHLTAPQAARRVYELSRAAPEHGYRYIYKKTDSTLRGNIASELGALLEAYSGSSLLYVPAYPAMGRTVRHGRLLVNSLPVSETEFAADPLNPVTESHIPGLLTGLGTLPVISLSPAALATASAPALYICDGEDESDLQTAARIFLKSKDLRLAAGPAGLTRYLAESMAPSNTRPVPWPRLRSALVVNGSRHPRSIQQVNHALQQGFAFGEASSITSDDTKNAWLVLQWTPPAGEGELSAAARLGRMVGEVLERTQPEALVIFGGDASYAVLRELGEPLIIPRGELLAGIPLSRIAVETLRPRLPTRVRDLYLITKAGAFGPEDVLASIRNLLSAS